MSQSDTIATVIQRGKGMLRMHLNDFTDAEMFARVAPTANHAAYQLSHLLRTTKGIVAAVAPDAAIPFPAKVEGDSKAPPTSDEPTAFASKDDLLKAYEAQVEAIAAGVRKMSDADCDKPAPEQFLRFAATLAQLALMVPLHMSMHVGQIQSLRRKLGKPVLF